MATDNLFGVLQYCPICDQSFEMFVPEDRLEAVLRDPVTECSDCSHAATLAMEAEWQAEWDYYAAQLPSPSEL